MKKIKVLFFALILMFVSVYNVCATSITLDQVVEKFNESSIVDDYKNMGGSISATTGVDSISVTASSAEETENLVFAFANNILSIEIDMKDSSALVKAYVATYMIDVVGQLHGYEEGQLMQTINSEDANNYTLEKEGYEVEEISETKLKIKMDITKKIPLLDFSDIYIEVSDLESMKEFISGDGSAEKSKGNMWFNKSGYDGDNTLLVAEKGNLTDNTYKSILSILEVMFDNDEVIKYFKSNYPDISSEGKDFNGFSIKVNPKEKTEWEESLIPSDSGYEFVRIIIDKQLAVSSAEKKGEESKITNYDITDGANQKYEVGTTEALVVRVDAEFELFEAVYLDDKLVDKSNYEVKSGSTIVTLKKEYLDKLSSGEHTIKISFKDGNVAQTKFNVEIKNAATDASLGYETLFFIIILGGIGYLLARKQRKFPRYN